MLTSLAIRDVVLIDRRDGPCGGASRRNGAQLRRRFDFRQHFMPVLARHVNIQKNDIRPRSGGIFPLPHQKIHDGLSIAHDMQGGLAGHTLDRFLREKSVGFFIFRH